MITLCRKGRKTFVDHLIVMQLYKQLGTGEFVFSVYYSAIIGTVIPRALQT